MSLARTKGSLPPEELLSAPQVLAWMSFCVSAGGSRLSPMAGPRDALTCAPWVTIKWAPSAKPRMLLKAKGQSCGGRITAGAYEVGAIWV
jgi:hypothetical protein